MHPTLLRAAAKGGEQRREGNSPPWFKNRELFSLDFLLERCDLPSEKDLGVPPQGHHLVTGENGELRCDRCGLSVMDQNGLDEKLAHKGPFTDPDVEAHHVPLVVTSPEVDLSSPSIPAPGHDSSPYSWLSPLCRLALFLARSSLTWGALTNGHTWWLLSNVDNLPLARWVTIELEGFASELESGTPAHGVLQLLLGCRGDHRPALLEKHLTALAESADEEREDVARNASMGKDMRIEDLIEEGHLSPTLRGDIYEGRAAKVRSSRRLRGTYFTPHRIARRIVELTLPTTQEGRSLSEWLGTVVLDPAAGCGHFLVQAALVLAHRMVAHPDFPDLWAEAMRKTLTRGAERAQSTQCAEFAAVLRHVISRRLYGVDVDEAALGIAEETLKSLGRLYGVDEQYLGELNLVAGSALGVQESPSPNQKRVHRRKHSKKSTAAPSRGPHRIQSLLQQAMSSDPLGLWSWMRQQRLMAALRQSADCPEDACRVEASGFKWEQTFQERYCYESESAASDGEMTFDFVIGNPPYVSYRALPSSHREFIRNSFDLVEGRFDLTIPFIQRGIESLVPGGRLGFIVTSKICLAEYAERLRRFLLEEVTLLSVEDASARIVFHGASAYGVILIAERRKPSPDHRVNLSRLEGSQPGGRPRLRGVDPKAFLEFPGAPITPSVDDETLEILLKMRGKGMSDAWGELRCGIARRGFSMQAVEKDNLAKIPPKERRKYKPLITGTHIEAYRLASEGAPRRHLPPTTASTQLWRRFSATKVVIPGIARELRAALDTSGHALGRVYFVTADSTPFPLTTLLGLLNSRLLRLYYRLLYWPGHLSGGYLRFNRPQISALPMPLDSLRNGSNPSRRRDATLLLEIGEAAGILSQLCAVESGAEYRLVCNIDEAVRRLFGLTEDEEEVLVSAAAHYTQWEPSRSKRRQAK